MIYEEEFENIVLKEVDSFSISETLECGQCFNFKKISDENYIVTANNKALHIFKENNNIVLENTTKNEFENFWKNYFDFERDYNSIKNVLGKKDLVMKNALDYAPGIRILNQEFFQCLISFIISQNNRIPRIKKIVYDLSKTYGTHLGEFYGEDYYSFPTPESLYNISVDELMECKMGFRAKYIADAVRKYVDGELNYENYFNLTTAEVRENLMTISGVGPKVADCVMLFSLKKSDAFPTDVWVQRVMSHFYFDGTDTKIKEIQILAENNFGEYAGFAQQYLFNYAKDFSIGADKKEAKK